MTQLSLDSASDIGDTLVCGLTPSGRIDVRPDRQTREPRCPLLCNNGLSPPSAPAAEGSSVPGCGRAGHRPSPHALLLARHRSNLRGPGMRRARSTDPKALVVPTRTPMISRLSFRPRSMQGAELITPALLADLWSEIGRALTIEAARHTDGVQAI